MNEEKAMTTLPSISTRQKTPQVSFSTVELEIHLATKAN